MNLSFNKELGWWPQSANSYLWWGLLNSESAEGNLQGLHLPFILMGNNWWLKKKPESRSFNGWRRAFMGDGFFRTKIGVTLPFWILESPSQSKSSAGRWTRISLLVLRKGPLNVTDYTDIYGLRVGSLLSLVESWISTSHCGFIFWSQTFCEWFGWIFGFSSTTHHCSMLILQ